MNFSGLQKNTLIDFPGRVAATVFTQGCNLRCPFCHNPELVLTSEAPEVYTATEILSFMESRKGKLDGLVVTGGEPLIHNNLKEFLIQIKDMGFEIKVDTNGGLPRVLEEYLNEDIADYYAMDIKSSWEGYSKATGMPDINIVNFKESVAFLKDCSVEYEFRTTVVRGLHNNKIVKSIGEIVKGAKKFTIQNYHEGKTIDPEFNDVKLSFSRDELKLFKEILQGYVVDVIIRE